MTPGAGMTQTPPYQVTDPATGEASETFPFARDAEVAEALTAATEAFAAWRLRPVAGRAAVVKRIAELFTERAAGLAALTPRRWASGPRRPSARPGSVATSSATTPTTAPGSSPTSRCLAVTPRASST